MSDQMQITTHGGVYHRDSAINEIDMNQVLCPETLTNDVVDQSIFEELERVKAERDAYYNKLVQVRNRIEMSKG